MNKIIKNIINEIIEINYKLYPFVAIYLILSGCFGIINYKGDFMENYFNKEFVAIVIGFVYTLIFLFRDSKTTEKIYDKVKNNNLDSEKIKKVEENTSSTPQISSTTTEIKKILNEGSDSIVYKLNDLYNNHKNTISNQEISSKLINQNVSVVNTILNELVNKIVFLDNHNKELENKIKILNEKIIILNQELEKSNLKQELNQDYEPNI